LSFDELRMSGRDWCRERCCLISAYGLEHCAIKFMLSSRHVVEPGSSGLKSLVPRQRRAGMTNNQYYCRPAKGTFSFDRLRMNGIGSQLGWKNNIIMNKHHAILTVILLSMLAMPGVQANTQPDQELYKGSNFALGIGAAIVRFDTKLKFTDKTRTNFDSIFIDPEGTLDLPETSSVTTFYGSWNINLKHSIGFSYFSANRESSLLNIDETFEDVRVVGSAKISDATNFYRLSYGYTLFNDYRSKIKFHAGIYGLDLKYVFEAQGQITQGGVTTSGSIKEEAKVFAPLPLIGIDLWYSFTPRWSINTKVAFVRGSYEDVSAGVLQTSLNALYNFTDHVGLTFGLAYFDADVEIEDDVEKIDISYGYDGGFIGLHFIF